MLPEFRFPARPLLAGPRITALLLTTLGIYFGAVLVAPQSVSAASLAGIGCTTDASGKLVFARSANSVAAGDIDGDGVDEWVASTGAGDLVVRRGSDEGVLVVGSRDPVASVAVVPANEIRPGGVVAALEAGGVVVIDASGEIDRWILDASFRARAVIVVDFEGDGRPDIVVARHGGGVFVVAAGAEPALVSEDDASALAIGDLDGDGSPEIVVALVHGGLVVRDTRGGTLGSLDTPLLRSLCALDLDGDLDDELLALDDSGRLLVLSGDLTRAFDPGDLPLEAEDGPFVSLTLERDEPEIRFVRGDANADERVDIGDAVTILGELFRGDVPRTACRKALDANDSGDIDISDAIFELSFLFLGGRPIPPPFPLPGLDPTPDTIPCAAN